MRMGTVERVSFDSMRGRPSKLTASRASDHSTSETESLETKSASTGLVIRLRINESRNFVVEIADTLSSSGSRKSSRRKSRAGRYREVGLISAEAVESSGETTRTACAGVLCDANAVSHLVRYE